VLDVVRRSHDHPTAREIFARVRERTPGIGFATVYRALNLLVEHGMVLELTLGDGSGARYDGNTGPHHHVLCLECGRAADVCVDLPEGTAREAEAASGFEVAGYALQFLGRCRDCAA
jgi:Fur family ferric uptake transcriptional regulator/Fur family peroxide stress response transcriptional regulator